MSRWQPNARGRLEQAAYELFSEKGYDDTTVAEIAGRAGLTERTFFRHFADKRETLFSGAGVLQEQMVAAIAAAPAGATPLALAEEALGVVSQAFTGRREMAGYRQRIIASHPDLEERELHKMHRLAEAMTGALRQRGVEEPVAALTAEVVTTVFRIAFARWQADPGRREMAALVEETLGALRGVLAGGD